MKKLTSIGLAVTALIFFNVQTQAKESLSLSMSSYELQANVSIELDSNIIAAYRRYGVNEAGIERMRTYLLSEGIKENKVNDVLKMIVRVIPSVPAEGGDFRLPEGALKYFKNLNLTDEQINVVKRSSMRIAKSPANPKNERERKSTIEDQFKRFGVGDMNRIKKHLFENGISADKIDRVLGGMVRVMHEVQAEGNDFELNPRMEEYFKSGLSLTDVHIKLIIGEAMRIVQKMRDAEGDKDKD